ncbi:unnamed protein product [Rotaria sp. Silwood2]|nr:unnamed protein product [Rotaria sp. Silwood2]
MTSRTSAFTHVLFKNIINNELMIASLEKCRIQDDNVTYTCGEKTFNGELITVGPKSLCNKLMKKMNGYTTDYLYSSLPEEDDDDGEDNDGDEDNENNVLKGDINPVSIRSSSPNVIRSSNDITNNNDSVRIIQDNGNRGSLSPYNNFTKCSSRVEVNGRSQNSFNETSFNASSSIVVPPVSEFSQVPHISPPKEKSSTKSSTNEQTRRKKGPVAFLPSSSPSKHLSPGMFPSIYALQTLEKGTLSLIFIFLIADRLANIEDAINNLIVYVNTLGEDVASIAVQLKPLLKNIKIIHNHIIPKNVSEVLVTSSSLRNSTSQSPSSSSSSKKVLMFKDTNLMQLKHDLTSIRSFLRKMTMAIYTRNEILSNKHLDERDERYATIIDALQNGFSLNDGTINALYASLKEARNQLTKDVRYLKVMKPKLDGNIANDDDGAPVQDVEIIDEDGHTQFQNEDQTF